VSAAITTEHPSPPGRTKRSLPAGLAALGAGTLVALSLPPWGWWPLAFVGIVIWDRLVADWPWRSRFARTFLWGVGWLAPGMGWMWFLTAPGYVVAFCLYSAYLATAAALSPPGRWRWLALPGAITVAEMTRWAFPFGGVPLANLAIAQVGGPLHHIARIGSAGLLTMVTVALGLGFSAALQRQRAVVPLVGVSVAVGLGAIFVAPRGEVIGELRIAIVQGGGEQGTRAVSSDPQLVFDRHVEATALIDQPVDVVLWPENVVDPVSGTLDGDPMDTDLRTLAADLGVPLIVGVTLDTPDRTQFVNEQVVYQPGSPVEIVDRYTKVRIVPFGEYMPFRDVLASIGAPTNLVPRDAVAGEGPAIVRTSAGDFAVVISWEVFFAGRAREGVEAGGSLILNPTNGSSYTGTVLQTQQVASSKLRAIETGRWVAQAAPTGFSAVITDTGDVIERTGQREQRVIVQTIELRSGRTWAATLGDPPIYVLGLALLVAGRLLDQRSRRRRSS
jgi:apolipoprotein N-acyltransferase